MKQKNNIQALQNLYYNYYFHQETQMDMGALALQIAVAVAVSVATAGAGAALMTSVVMSTALATSAATAALIAVGTQYGMSAAMSGGEHGTEAIQSGSADSTTTRTTLITSSLLFGGNLNLNAGNDANTQTANIKADNVSQEIKQSSTTSLTQTHTDIEPDYGNIAKGAAITGFIAGATVVASKAIEAYTGSKPTFNRAEKGAVYKPDDTLLKDPKFMAKYPDYNGVIDPTANNIGLANTTGDLAQVGQPVNHSTYEYFVTKAGNEGGVISDTCNLVGGCNSMSVMHDPWSGTAFIKGTPGMTQISIIPALVVEYYALGGGVGAGILSDAVTSTSNTTGNTSTQSVLFNN